LSRIASTMPQHHMTMPLIKTATWLHITDVAL
jgi:hypothetical protein